MPKGVTPKNQKLSFFVAYVSILKVKCRGFSPPQCAFIILERSLWQKLIRSDVPLPMMFSPVTYQHYLPHTWPWLTNKPTDNHLQFEHSLGDKPKHSSQRGKLFSMHFLSKPLYRARKSKVIY